MKQKKNILCAGLILLLCGLLASVYFTAPDGKEIVYEQQSTIEASVDKTADMTVTETEQTEEITQEETVPEQTEAPWDDSLYSAPQLSSVRPDMENLRGIHVEGCTKTSEPGICVILGSCDLGTIVLAVDLAGKVLASCKSFQGCFTLRLPYVKGDTVILKEVYRGNTLTEERRYSLYPTNLGPSSWGVIAGYEGQFFLKKAVQDYEGSNLLTEQEQISLRNDTKNHVETARQLGADGCEIIYLVMPSAMSVYPERVPETIQPGEITKYEQMLTIFREGGATVIDLLPVLQAHTDDALPLYARFDSHCTEYGAYLAYVELFKHISEEYPAATPRQFDEFDWQGKYYAGGDIIYYLGMRSSDVEEYLYLRTPKFELRGSTASIRRYKSSYSMSFQAATEQVKEYRKVGTGDELLPDIMVYRDSYSTYLYDILSERSNTTTWLYMWDCKWNSKEVMKREPDYIVYFITEWNLDSLR